jgi:ATP/maltotriose-dependent transcriptional regulator MalT
MEDVETTPVGELHLAGFAHPFVGFAVDALRRVEAPPAATSHSLTQREWQVVDLIVEGYTNREIAEALVIAEGTSVKHVANVLAKLELRSRTQVAAWAVLRTSRRLPNHGARSRTVAGTRAAITCALIQKDGANQSGP